MNMMKRIFLCAMALSLALSLLGCGGESAGETTAPASETPSDPSAEPTGGTEAGGEEIPTTYSLEFREQVESWTQTTNAKHKVSYYTANAVYCANPTHAGVQSMDIYCPVDYLNPDGTLNTGARVGQYTAETAPIVFWNSHGSYIGMGPFKISGNSTRATQYGWVLNMVENGIVVCMVGERGKLTKDENGSVIGRGPVAIGDLKAGVRFLKHNDAVIPGDSQRIISVGTSSGGAMSALLGASGNNSYYDAYLEAIGACMDETDDVYAVQAYCPITDFAHADYAYEWMFGVDNENATDFQKALSGKLALEYVSFINGLGLEDENGNPLTLAEDGSKSGSYYDWLVAKYEAAFEDYAANFDSDYAGFATGAGAGAADAEALIWLDYDAAAGKATLVTPEGYASALDAMILTGYRPRQKEVLAFDSFGLFNSDNEVYGIQGTAVNAEGSARHFNPRIAEMIAELRDAYPDAYEQYYQAYYDDSHTPEVEDWLVYLNAYSFVTGLAESDIAPHFRINMGVQDADTTPMVSATLALLLQKNGVDAQFNLLWAWGHNDVDTPTGLLDWILSICQ